MLEKMDLKHLLLLLMAAIWVAGLYPERALAETNVYLDREDAPSRQVFSQYVFPNRKKVAVVLIGDTRLLAEEKITQDIDWLLKKKFPTKNFELYSGAMIETDLNERLEDHMDGYVTDTWNETERRPVKVTTDTIETKQEKPKFWGGTRVLTDMQTRTHSEYVDSVVTTDQYKLPEVSRSTLGVNGREYLGTGALFDLFRKDDYVRAGRKFGYDYILVLPIYHSCNLDKRKDSFFANMLQSFVTVRARLIDVQKGEYLYRVDTFEKGETGDMLFPPGHLRAVRKALNRCLLKAFNDMYVENGGIIEVSKSELDYGAKW